MSQASVWVAQLEFEHVQQYLFEGTTLKTMIGANTLLGEFLRGRLTTTGFRRLTEDLPALTRQFEAALPDGVDPGALQVPTRRNNVDPLADQDDPLRNNVDPLADQDDPLFAWKEGVLSHDGGHFQAVFRTAEAAQGFLGEARRIAAQSLPGLVLAAQVLHLTEDNGRWKVSKAEERPRGAASLPIDLPQQQVCRDSGQGPAAQTNDGDIQFISRSVAQKYKATERFDNNESHDIVGLLKNVVLQRLKLVEPDAKQRYFPAEFEKVAERSGYLAVLAADGNGIGSRSRQFRSRIPVAQGYFDFQREANSEQFFHDMRVLVREALVAALVEVFQKAAEEVRQRKRKTLPFRLLMQGGDDLLLVCDAIYALPFVVAYAQRLGARPLIDTKPLDVGVGVAIVKKKFPFHRSHALAEQLAASAKRLYRTLPEGQRGSVIDWLSITEAWHEDVREVRDRDTVRRFPGETLLLSRKPYLILGDDSLETLLKAAKLANESTTDADQTRAARSQLIALAHGLPLGSLQADQALRLLPDDARRHLEPVLTRTGEGDSSLWHRHTSNVYSTAVMDFLELFELERLRVRSEKHPGASS